MSKAGYRGTSLKQGYLAHSVIEVPLYSCDVARRTRPGQNPQPIPTPLQDIIGMGYAGGAKGKNPNVRRGGR